MFIWLIRICSPNSRDHTTRYSTCHSSTWNAEGASLTLLVVVWQGFCNLATLIDSSHWDGTWTWSAVAEHWTVPIPISDTDFSDSPLWVQLFFCHLPRLASPAQWTDANRFCSFGSPMIQSHHSYMLQSSTCPFEMLKCLCQCPCCVPHLNQLIHLCWSLFHSLMHTSTDLCNTTRACQTSWRVTHSMNESEQVPKKPSKRSSTPRLSGPKHFRVLDQHLCRYFRKAHRHYISL